MLEERLKTIISSCVLGIDKNQITESTDLMEDLGFESVNLVELIVDIENEFGIEIEDEFLDIEVLSSFNRLVDMLEKLTGYKNKTA